MKTRVLLGMSGGIDSTVSAMLLLEQGYEVVGVTCCSVESIMEAKHNAEKMGFEHHIVDFRDTFRQCVIQNFIDEYMAGRTPNPCVLCNSHIKWGELMRVADEYGCVYIATGHYARIAERDGHLFLRTAVDTKKDQTYFLWMLTEEQLKRTIFPLGDLTKDEVREIAREHGYEKLAVKRESQEICFIPNDDYRSFLRANVPDYTERVRAGEYIDKDGKVLGYHQGYVNYTIGQRKGLGIALGQPAYITHINAATNRITLGTNEDMYASELKFKNRRLIANSQQPLFAKVRYRSQAVEVTSHSIDDRTQTGSLVFSEPVWGVTPGQSVVLYQDDLVVGGGIIQ